MNGFCCCQCPEDFEEYAHPNNPIYRQCIYLKHFFQQLFSMYNQGFQRLEVRSMSPVQAATPLTSAATLGTNVVDSSLSETHHKASRPPPYDSDPRYARAQREGLVSRRDKSVNFIQEDLQLLRRNGSTSGTEHLGAVTKWSISESEEDYKVSRSESSRGQSAKANNGGYGISNAEDEDVCPTCLDEYTPDNPKIVAKCCHHFHLSCIYEWMERSDSCPVCGKDMEFCESP